MAFPHRQLKPGVLKVVEQLDQDTDLRELVVNYAIGPWFKKARELLEREQWQAALGYLDSANSAAPGVVVVLFHKALCHFQLEQWDAAESTAKEARGRCGPDDEQALEQLETMLDQLPLARTAKQMEKVQKAMERDDWPEAARLLDGILKTAPKSIPALFYRAVCHMHMDEWDQAESVARSTLKLCKASDSAAKEQLNLMLEQLPMAKESAALKPVTKALEREDWASAIREVEKYLSSNPKSAIGHFYKGLAQFRSKLPRDAHASAKAGLACATKTTPKEIRSQLEQLLEASDLPPWIEKMNQAVEEMNRDNWTKAIGRLDEVLAMDYSNAQAYFYRGLARFRATMEEIKSAGGVGPYMASYYSDKFETAQEDVNKAIRHAPVSEKELKKAAATLQKNITQALAQLNRF
jgi:tetratricopeptide (TPR) repeat protein